MKELFISREGTTGRSLPTNIVEGVKRKFKSWTDPTTATDEDWKKHFEGGLGLGLSPILQNNNCRWAAIDVDNYDIDIDILSRKYHTLPLLFCRTKSGGLHIFMFFEKELSAKKVRAFCYELVYLLRLPPSYTKAGTIQEYEIFPKQDKADKGNWINLPYFGGDATDRYCLHNGLKLTYKQFVELSKSKLIKKVKSVLANFLFYGAPPCIQKMISQGVVEGQRDTFLLNAGLFLKKRFLHNWVEKVIECTTKYMDNPIGEDEVRRNVISTLEKDKGKLFYQCKTTLVSYCDKSLCYSRPWGIASDKSIGQAIEGIKKIQTEETNTLLYWEIMLKGKWYKIDSDTLLNQVPFKKFYFDRMNVVLARVQGHVWEELLNTKVEDLVIEKAPEEAGKESMLAHVVKDFFLAYATDIERHIENKQVIKKGNVYFFHANSLVKYVLEVKRQKIHTEDLYHYLKSLGLEQTRSVINGSRLRLWQLPLYKEHAEEHKKEDDAKKYTLPKWSNYEEIEEKGAY